MMMLFDGDISRGRSQQEKSILCCFVVVLSRCVCLLLCIQRRAKASVCLFSSLSSACRLRLRISQNDCEKLARSSEKEIKEERRGLMATPNMTTNKQTNKQNKQQTADRPTDTKIQTRNKTTTDTSDTKY
jgi:hypothetical protein